MSRSCINPVVHLQLETGNLPRACAFYTQLLGWRAEVVRVEAGSYVALHLSGDLDGGVVECDTRHPQWIPYVEVSDVEVFSASAQAQGAAVVLEPRECATGWRSVLLAPSGEKLALWQRKM